MRPVAVLICLLFLSGCIENLRGADHDEPRHGFPSTYDGPPVSHQEAAAHGKWHASLSLTGSAAWVVRLEERPSPANWTFRWLPDKPGGYLVVSGVTVEPVRGAGFVAMGPLSAGHAVASEDEIWRVDVVENYGKQGPWFVLLIVEAYNASGQFDLVVDWDEGPNRTWEPSFREAHEKLQTDVHILSPGESLQRDLPTDGLRAVHVIVPCEFRELRRQEVHLDVGQAPTRLQANMTQEDGRYENWYSHFGFWSYQAETFPVRIENRGEIEETIVILRSSSSFTTDFQAQTGYPLAVAGSRSDMCTPQ